MLRGLKAKFLNYFIGICVITYFTASYAKPLLNEIIHVVGYSKIQELLIQYFLSFGLVCLSIGFGALFMSTIQLMLNLEELKKSHVFDKIFEHLVLSSLTVFGGGTVLMIIFII